MDLEIKKATPKYCSTILSIAKEGGLFNYTYLIYSILIALGWVYIVLDEDKVVGYISYIKFPGLKKSFTLQMGITKEYRNRGIGTEMLDFLCKEVKRRHRVDTILAHTLKPRVVKLFKRQSWNVVISVLGIVLVKKKIR